MPAPASHPEIIELLEIYLESAKTKKWAAVGIAMVGHPNVACSDFVGEVNAEEMLEEAVQRLGGKVTASMRTPVCLSSGCLDSGSNAGCVRTLTPPLRKRSPQCMGKNAWPGRTLSSLLTGTIKLPRRLFRLTRSPACRR